MKGGTEGGIWHGKSIRDPLLSHPQTHMGGKADVFVSEREWVISQRHGLELQSWEEAEMRHSVSLKKENHQSSPSTSSYPRPQETSCEHSQGGPLRAGETLAVGWVSSVCVGLSHSNISSRWNPHLLLVHTLIAWMGKLRIREMQYSDQGHTVTMVSYEFSNFRSHYQFLSDRELRLF